MESRALLEVPEHFISLNCSSRLHFDPYHLKHLYTFSLRTQSPGQPEPYSETLSQKFSFAVANRGWYCCYMQEKIVKKKKNVQSLVWWSISSAFGRQRLKCEEFKSSLSYLRLCLRKTSKLTNKKKKHNF